jgi:choline kinase
MKHTSVSAKPVTTALLLAAGTGSRLYPLTKHAPKCLTLVNGRSILERLVFNLNQHGFKRLVVVTGHLEEHIRSLLGKRVGDVQIDYVRSPLYETTNNIYSLWMARHMINTSFLLLESDLVFDAALLDDMLCPDKMAVARLQSWMNGTCVTIDEHQRVKAFLAGDADSFGETKYKTVNIYSISLVSWRRILKQLEERVAAGDLQHYYESVFGDMVSAGSLSFDSVSFDHKPWYEIDTLEDLAKAEELLSSPSSEARTQRLHAPVVRAEIPPQRAVRSRAVAALAG